GGARASAAEPTRGTAPAGPGSPPASQPPPKPLTKADGIIPSHTGPAGQIGRAILGNLLPPRRPRVSARKVKSPLSRWNQATPGRPARSTPITSLTATVTSPIEHTAPRRQQRLSDAPGPEGRADH